MHALLGVCVEPKSLLQDLHLVLVCSDLLLKLLYV